MTLACEHGAALRLDGDHTAFFLEAAASRSAVVLGCGLGQAPETQAFIRAFLAGVSVPLLIDADGLNALDASALRQYTLSWAKQAPDRPIVITPHPKELARLSGLKSSILAQDRVGHARRFAQEWGGDFAAERCSQRGGGSHRGGFYQPHRG